MRSRGCTAAVLELLATPARAIIIAADPGRRARHRGFPDGAAQEKIDVREISGWSGSMPTITFQWCLSQSATISSPLGIVRTRTTAGRLSDPTFAILDSPCEHQIPAYRLALVSAIRMVSRECSMLRSIHWSTKRLNP